MRQNETGVVILSVQKLSKLVQDGDHEKIVPIRSEQYEHCANFFPSRTVRGLRKGHEFGIGTVGDVPKRPKPTSKSVNGKGDGEGKLPTCVREPEIFVTYDEKRNLLKVNENNARMKNIFLAEGIKITTNDMLKHWARETYEYMSGISHTLATIANNLNECEAKPEFTNENSVPKYLDGVDYLINKYFEQQFESCKYLKDLCVKIAKEKAKRGFQAVVEEAEAAPEVLEEEEALV